MSTLLNHIFIIICGLIIFIKKLTVVHGWYPSQIPEYCSKNMTDRYITPLSNEERQLVSKLLQVQVMIRHGARTPVVTVPTQCWKSYNIDWHNCKSTTSLQEYSGYTKENPSSSWSVEKLYLNGESCVYGQMLPEGFNQEVVNGDILRKAYINNAMEDTKHDQLRLFESNEIDLNTLSFYSDDMERTLLSGQTVLNNMFPNIISSDTTVRWNIVDSLFDWVYCHPLQALVHEAYSSSDFMAVNNSIKNQYLTEILNSLWGGIDTSGASSNGDAGSNRVVTNSHWSWRSSLDCVMTAVCTGNELPSSSSSTTTITSADKESSEKEEGADKIVMDEDIFNQIIEHDEFTYKYLLTYKKNQIAKAINKRIVMIMKSHIENLLSTYKSTDGGRTGASDTQDSRSSTSNSKGYSKFVFSSSHDTNIMSLLALILGHNWDGKRAFYASLVSIEIYAAAVQTETDPPTDNPTNISAKHQHHSIIESDSMMMNDEFSNNVGKEKLDTQFYFRLLYNGKPQRMHCCTNYLCDVKRLINALQSAATDNTCSSETTTTINEDPSNINTGITTDDDSDIINGTEWMLSMIFVLLLGLLVGASTMFFINKFQSSRLPNLRGSSSNSSPPHYYSKQTNNTTRYTALQSNSSNDMEDQIDNIEMTDNAFDDNDR